MTVSNRWNRLRYSLYAPVYDLGAKPMASGRKRAIERLDITAGDSILILGCGTGMGLKYLPRGVDVTAVDLTPAMVRRTERRAETLGFDVDTRVEDARNLPFEGDSFDSVLLHLILSVAPDPGDIVAESERVLTSDGEISIFDKFAPVAGKPGLGRRLLNPLAKLLFADLNRPLGPMLAGTGLTTDHRESFLGGLYTVTVARPAQSSRSASGVHSGKSSTSDGGSASAR